MALYKIVRHYKEGGRSTIKTDLYLEEAQAHCKDPETSSKTATSAAARRRTRQKGEWFDGYEQEREVKHHYGRYGGGYVGRF